MNLKAIVLCNLFMLIAITAIGQKKYEKESRLKQEKVPSKALQFINSLDKEIKQKWFFEENLKGNSIEAKFKLNKKKYSVEFDTIGNLQDIEIVYDYKELIEVEQKRITKSLKKSFESYKIKKIQKQYTGDIATLATFESAKSPNEICNYAYEIVLKAKKNKEWKLFEIAMNAKGEIIEISEIIFRNTDNLEY